MFTRLHLKQEPHHDSAHPDDWEGRNREEGTLEAVQLCLAACLMISNANIVGPLDSTLHCKQHA